MKKNVFVVSFERETPVHVVADRMTATSEGVFFYDAGQTGAVARFREYVSVTLEGDLRTSGLVAGAEPISTLGATACFSSSASPLVEAIESTTRLIQGLEESGVKPIFEPHLTVIGGLYSHLDTLLAEQLGQLRIVQ